MVASQRQPMGLSQARWPLILVLAASFAGGGYSWFLWPRDPFPAEFDGLPRALESATSEVVQAVQEATAGVRAAPTSGPAWGELAMVLRAHGFDQPADEAFRRAESLSPDEFRWPYLLGLSMENVDPDEAEACFRRAIALEPELALPRLSLGEMLLGAERENEAEALFREALEYEARGIRALLGLARTRLAHGEDQQALVFCQQAVERQPRERMCHELLARVYFRLGQHEDARRERDLLALMPQQETSDDPYVAEVIQLRQDPNWIATRAQTMFELGQTDRGVAYLEEVIRTHPGRALFPLELARALGGSGQLERAVDLLGRTIENHPDSSELRLLEGLVFRELGRAGPAEASFQAAIARKPDHAEAWLWLGRTRLASGQVEPALEAFRNSARYRPDLPEAHAALGELLLRRNRAKEAVPHLETAVDLAPGDSQLRRRLIEARQAIREKSPG